MANAWSLYLADLIFGIRVVAIVFFIDAFVQIFTIRAVCVSNVVKLALEDHSDDADTLKECLVKQMIKSIPAIIISGVIAFLIPSRETILAFLA